MARDPSWWAEAATAGRAAPPLIVAALAEVTIGGCPAGPHCGTRAHWSGARTDNGQRAGPWLPPV